eukprot:GHVN01004228.1.p1 GENE.GHVN01004228.1~~GHVN01004228.1.p1  ORF type:complete len:437 (+),score=42.85 GHVN01004228.1:1491-2801(+)
MGNGGSQPVMAPISSNLEEAKKGILRRSKKVSVPLATKRRIDSSRLDGSVGDEESITIYGPEVNHLPVLEDEVLQLILPFLNGPSFYNTLGVCRHWFIHFYAAMHRRCLPIVKRFKEVYANHLEVQRTLIDIQPIFTARSSMRVDLLLYAKALPSCSNKCLQLGYNFRYLAPTPTVSEAVSTMGPSFDEHTSYSSNYMGGNDGDESPVHELTKDGKILVPQSSSYGRGRDAPQAYECTFRFDCLSQKACRTMWIHKDICRFHGDEIMVAFLPSIPSLCVGDLVEVAINISNGFGVADVDNLTWALPKLAGGIGPGKGRTCEIENQYKLWHDMETFQQSTTEQLSSNDLFGPQWRLSKTEFAGIDITCSRSTFKAVEIGDVPRSRELLNLNLHVVPKGTAIVCPLKRQGMQHDRFTRQWVRQGDTILLYISQGGGIA